MLYEVITRLWRDLAGAGVCRHAVPGRPAAARPDPQAAGGPGARRLRGPGRGEGNGHLTGPTFAGGSKIRRRGGAGGNPDLAHHPHRRRATGPALPRLEFRLQPQGAAGPSQAGLEKRPLSQGAG